jgi:hypothetical protein
MKKSTRRYISRTLSNNLLDSELTEIELIDFCDAILSGDRVIEDIARGVLLLLGEKNLSPSISTSPRSKKTNNIKTSTSKSMSEVIEETYIFLKENKISKNKIYHAMELLSPELGSYVIHNNLSVMKTLEYYATNSTRAQFQKFRDSFKEDDFYNIIIGA